MQINYNLNLYIAKYEIIIIFLDRAIQQKYTQILWTLMLQLYYCDITDTYTLQIYIFLIRSRSPAVTLQDKYKYVQRTQLEKTVARSCLRTFLQRNVSQFGT